MTWKDDLLPAKLDDVEFHYRSVKDRAGNRNVLHEFPGGDAPFVEELGRKAQRWIVEAFLLGENYHVALHNLTDVLDTPGVRKFQHPYKGELPAKLLGEYVVTRTDTEGGIGKVAFTLVEAGLGFPLTPVDSGANVRKLAGLALLALEGKTKFSLLGAIKGVIAAVLGALGKALSAINKVNGKIAAALGVLDSAAFLVDSIGDSLTKLINTPGALMNKLNNLLGSVIGLVTGLLDLVPQTAVGVEEPHYPQADILLETFVALSAFEALPEAIPTNTPQAALEVAAVDAVNLNISAATLALTASAATTADLESAAGAAKMQAALVGGFDKTLATPDLDPEVAEIFAALKAETVKHLTAVQQDLPNLSAHIPKQTLPALVVAYELYEDASRDGEILRRNKVRHPNFLAGGVPLEVIADD